MRKTLLLFLMGLSSLYLQAQNSVVNAELVKTFPSPIQSVHLHPAGNKLLIYAQINGSSCELWSSDGTTSGTTMIFNEIANYDIQRGYTGYNGLVDINGQYFIRPALKTSFAGVTETEPMLTDGMSVTTLAQLYPNTATNAYSSAPYNFTKFDNKVYFAASTATGNKVFYFTGTGQPAAITGIASFSEAMAFSNNSMLILSGSSITGTKGLYRIDAGSTTPALITTFENIYSLQNLGDKVIFWGKKSSTDAIGYELYMTDGTAGGTVLLKDLVSGSQSPVISFNESYMVRTTGRENSFIVLNTTPVSAYFKYQDPTTSQYHLCRTDGTPSGTISLLSITGSINSPHKAGNKVAFQVYDQATSKSSVRVTDGTAPTMLMSGDKAYSMSIGGAEGGYTYDGSGNFIMDAYDPVTGSGVLIVTDGTSAGTRSVKVNFPETGFISSSDDYTVIGNNLYFVNGYSIFRINLSNITAATTPVHDIPSRSARLMVYPNPVTGREVTIEGAGSLSTNSEVSLYNMAGSKVYGGTVRMNAGKGKLELNALPQGIYTIELQTAQEKRSSLIVIR